MSKTALNAVDDVILPFRSPAKTNFALVIFTTKLSATTLKYYYKYLMDGMEDSYAMTLARRMAWLKNDPIAYTFYLASLFLENDD